MIRQPGLSPQTGRARFWGFHRCAPLALLSLAVLTAGAATPPGKETVQEIFRWRPFLAPFHSVVLHFPIGFFTVAFILELYQIRHPSEEVRRVTRLVIWLSLLSSLVAAGLGILRAQNGEYDPDAVARHRIFGLAVPALLFLTLFAQKLSFRDTGRRILLHTYRAALMGTLAVTVVAGHLGGNLTHGSRYLVENAPLFVREWIDTPPSQTVMAAAASENERFYSEKVQPIFAAKCYSCHGSQKQKSGYRLDDPEMLLKGGESGKTAIKPGDPGASHLVRLILLPPEDDDVMPPSGKERLNNDEVMTILTWIQKGATVPVGASPNQKN